MAVATLFLIPTLHQFQLIHQQLHQSQTLQQSQLIHRIHLIHQQLHQFQALLHSLVLTHQGGRMNMVLDVMIMKIKLILDVLTLTKTKEVWVWGQLRKIAAIARILRVKTSGQHVKKRPSRAMLVWHHFVKKKQRLLAVRLQTMMSKSSTNKRTRMESHSSSLNRARMMRIKLLVCTMSASATFGCIYAKIHEQEKLVIMRLNIAVEIMGMASSITVMMIMVFII
mmetsp:Transcript_22205/g.34297  ORF Transcript_22205/g.34297 Transcript_22205/m.34297 type:complete len:225 (+) Transcript_22205:892-1566(+)